MRFARFGAGENGIVFRVVWDNTVNRFRFNNNSAVIQEMNCCLRALSNLLKRLVKLAFYLATRQFSGNSLRAWTRTMVKEDM